MNSKNISYFIYIRAAGALWAAAAVCAFVRRSGIAEDWNVLLLIGAIVFGLGGVALAAVFIVKCRKQMSFSDPATILRAFDQLRASVYGDDDEGKEVIAITSVSLGKFVYRRRPDWYEHNCDWCGEKVAVTFTPAENAKPEDYIVQLETLFGDCTKHDSEIRKRVALSWGEELAARIMPAFVRIEPDFEFKLFYSDDAKQTGTVFIAKGTAKEGIREVTIKG